LRQATGFHGGDESDLPDAAAGSSFYARPAWGAATWLLHPAAVPSGPGNPLPVEGT